MRNFSKQQWRDTFPDLSIEEQSSTISVEFDAAKLSTIADQIWDRGYIHENPVFEPHELAPLAKALHLLSQQGVPPVYIYLFDEPWFLFDRLGELVSHFLGDNYALLPNLWAWYFDKPGDRGWHPHQDCHSETVFNIGGDKMLMSLSLWIPLTDVTPENGCMHVLPRNQEYNLQNNKELDQTLLEPFARALPAKAGSVLGWPQDLVHWGGTFADEAAPPRASLSLEFQNTAFDPLTAPFLDAGSPPSFDQRMALIQAQFEKYKHIASQSEAKFF